MKVYSFVLFFVLSENFIYLFQAKLKRRIVCGLREVKKFVQVDKIKCIVVAPNIDSITSSG